MDSSAIWDNCRSDRVQFMPSVSAIIPKLYENP